MANLNSKAFGHVSVNVVNVCNYILSIKEENFGYFRAFGWEPPLFAHLPLILNTKGDKLSKRHDDANVDYYK